MRRALLVAAALLALWIAGGAGVLAGDWPSWRGGRGGVSDEAGLPERWSAEEGVRWKAPLPGRGVSSPVVVRGRAFVTCASGPGEERLHLVCIDAAGGEVLWERQLWATGSTQCHPKTSMAAPTPAADPERACALFASCDAAAFTRDGTLLWCRALSLDYPDVSNQVGMAASPVLWRGLLIVSLETDSDAFVLALDAGTGENRWKLPREKGINWATPVLLEAGATAALVLQSPRGLAAHEPSTGALLWRHAAKLDSIASAVAGEGEGGALVLAPGGETIALRPPRPGGEPEVVWRSNKLRTSTASLTCYGGRAYGVNSAGVLTCARAEDGEVLWQERLEGPFAASPVAGDGKVYCVNEAGVAAVIDARPDAPVRVLATCPLGEPVLASPAIAGASLYIRTERHFYRIGGGGQGARR
ncbi:MAG: PQQ-binding-like beta-propeller repeat protein [Planctomycetes bacterium]|nr:PQQ-binding-like beta-propeller repeat protein [Planctomycetota bacterium]